ncbi:carbon starvation protein A [soil metagenome]
MQLLAFLLLSAVLLYAAYAIIGRMLARMFKLSSETQATPAFKMRDGLDYEPARTAALVPQHFSAIAAAGPIVGPILAAKLFGWGPAWLWIIIGGALIGGIHDFVALVASVRHGAKSIAEIVRQNMNPRAYFLFLAFVWFALIYVIIAFTDVTAGTFVAKASAAGGDAPGPAVASSSMLYLGLAVVMGILLRKTKLTPGVAKMIFLPLVLLAIFAGAFIPLDISSLAGGNSQMVWGYILLAYCFVAAMAPVWALLQPRGELGGYFLYLVMALILGGVAVTAFTGAHHIEQPFFKGWVDSTTGSPLFPILFITVACGACSGFHSIIASGTTSKQLERECDARMVGYGSMLLESFFACMSLVTVMIIPVAIGIGKPDAVYAGSIADLARGIVSLVKPVSGTLGDDAIYQLLYRFALLCFATFVFDTLDACTRLARYVLMEALHWETRGQAVAATIITLAFPCMVLPIRAVTLNGQQVPLWQVFWNIFGSSNQLLAALTLLGLTMWLARKKMAWQLTFAPTIFMMTMTLWSLYLNIGPYITKWNSGNPMDTFTHLQFAITCSLIALSVWLIIEALITAAQIMRPPAGQTPELAMGMV